MFWASAEFTCGTGFFPSKMLDRAYTLLQIHLQCVTLMIKYCLYPNTNFHIVKIHETQIKRLHYNH